MSIQTAVPSSSVIELLIVIQTSPLAQLARCSGWRRNRQDYRVTYRNLYYQRPGVRAVGVLYNASLLHLGRTMGMVPAAGHLTRVDDEEGSGGVM